VVISVGRLVPIKGHGTLLEALSLLARQDARVRCRIVGGGPLEDALRAKIRELHLEDTVELLGPRDHHEVKRLLADADVFVLACTRDRDGNMDGIPVALMEAMAAGVPVVSTDISGVPELVTPETGLLVEPDNPEALADALARLLGDADFRESLGQGGRERVQRCFSRAQQVDQMFRVLTGAAPPE
jgi:glycosyltransferase involved in cell wall biosynthesis